MCWACDMDDAKALLIDSVHVLEEAKTLKKHGTHMQAQALDAKYKAEVRCEKNSSLCAEVDESILKEFEDG